jgi:hypothetical protein
MAATTSPERARGGAAIDRSAFEFLVVDGDTGACEGVLHRLAPGEHCRHQVQHRPTEVMVRDQEIPVI